LASQRVIGSPGYPPTEAELRSYVERAYDRCYHPAGTARQMAAVFSDRGRAERLAEIAIPFLVVHGSDDPLIPVACGEDTAKRVPGAKLELIQGMGHDVTEANAPILARLLIEFARS
jgi:pimeloyl-ACP methyl ester carboxylesterase